MDICHLQRRSKEPPVSCPPPASVPDKRQRARFDYERRTAGFKSVWTRAVRDRSETATEMKWLFKNDRFDLSLEDRKLSHGCTFKVSSKLWLHVMIDWPHGRRVSLGDTASIVIIYHITVGDIFDLSDGILLYLCIMVHPGELYNQSHQFRTAQWTS